MSTSTSSSSTNLVVPMQGSLTLTVSQPMSGGSAWRKALAEFEATQQQLVTTATSGNGSEQKQRVVVAQNFGFRPLPAKLYQDAKGILGMTDEKGNHCPLFTDTSIQIAASVNDYYTKLKSGEKLIVIGDKAIATEKNKKRAKTENNKRQCNGVAFAICCVWTPPFSPTPERVVQLPPMVIMFTNLTGPGGYSLGNLHYDDIKDKDGQPVIYDSEKHTTDPSAAKGYMTLRLTPYCVEHQDKQFYMDEQCAKMYLHFIDLLMEIALLQVNDAPEHLKTFFVEFNAVWELGLKVKDHTLSDSNYAFYAAAELVLHKCNMRPPVDELVQGTEVVDAMTKLNRRREETLALFRQPPTWADLKLYVAKMKAGKNKTMILTFNHDYFGASFGAKPTPPVSHLYHANQLDAEGMPEETVWGPVIMKMMARGLKYFPFIVMRPVAEENAQPISPDCLYLKTGDLLAPAVTIDVTIAKPKEKSVSQELYLNFKLEHVASRLIGYSVGEVNATSTAMIPANGNTDMTTTSMSKAINMTPLQGFEDAHMSWSDTSVVALSEKAKQSLVHMIETSDLLDKEKQGLKGFETIKKTNASKPATSGVPRPIIKVKHNFPPPVSTVTIEEVKDEAQPRPERISMDAPISSSSSSSSSSVPMTTTTTTEKSGKQQRKEKNSTKRTKLTTTTTTTED